MTKKKKVVNEVKNEDLIVAIAEIGAHEKELKAETWRLNEKTRSSDSVWNRLSAKLKLDATEENRHRLYNAWRRKILKMQSKTGKTGNKKNEPDKASSSSGNNNDSEQSDSSALDSKLQDTHRTRSHSDTVEEKVEEKLPVVVEATIILSGNEWKSAFSRTHRKMKPGWTDIFYTKLSECGFNCTICFKTPKLKKGKRKQACSFFPCNAVCNRKMCHRVFRIDLEQEPEKGASVMFFVRAMGEECHDAKIETSARKLTGIKRFIIGKLANRVGPRNVFQKRVAAADEDLLNSGNLTDCESIETLKKASSDFRQKTQLDENVFKECRMLSDTMEETDTTSEKVPGYIQVSGEKPFRLHNISEPQLLRYVSYCTDNFYSHIYMDATGSIIQKFRDQKRCLLYALIFKDGTDATNVVPLAHALLSDHTVPSIAYFLGTIRQKIVVLKDRMIRPSFFVIDFSPAILNAILQVFNYQDIHGHLRRCWNVLQRKYDTSQLRSSSFIRFCCSHVIHAFGRSLTALKVEKGLREKIMHVFALFINCTELEQAFQFFSSVLRIFGQSNSKDAENLLENFLKIPYDDENSTITTENLDQNEETITDPLDEVDESSQGSGAIIHQSPFNKEAIRRFPVLLDLLDPKKKYENIENPLFSRRVVLVFYKWFAYVPLWTSLLYKFEERYSTDNEPCNVAESYGPGRLSNAEIEGYFDVVKNSILEKKTKLRPAALTRKLFRSIMIQMKARRFYVTQSSKGRKKAKAEDVSVEAKDVNVEEGWGKTTSGKKSRSKYLRGPKTPQCKRLQSTPISVRKMDIISSADISSALQSCLPTAAQFKDNHPVSLVDTSKKDNSRTSWTKQATFDQIDDEEDNLSRVSIETIDNVLSTLVQWSTDNNLKKSTTDSILPIVKPGQRRGNKRPCSRSEIECMTAAKSKRRIPSPKGPPTHNVRPQVRIDGYTLFWPQFNIRRATFEGRSYSIENTCNVDSALFVIYYLFFIDTHVHELILNSTAEPFTTLRKTFELVDTDGWNVARLYWLLTINRISNTHPTNTDLFGSVDENASRFIKQHLQIYESVSTCSRSICPQRNRMIRTTDLSILPSDADISKFEFESVSTCTAFVKRLSEVIPSDVDENFKVGKTQMFNLQTNSNEYILGLQCGAERLNGIARFVNDYPPIIFIDVAPLVFNEKKSEKENKDKYEATATTLRDLRPFIQIGTKRYRLRATINHESSHFTATIITADHDLFLYDDMIGVQSIDKATKLVETAVYTEV